jgi:adenylate cyclase
MAQEIERKFLVSSMDFKNEAFKNTHIVQGYLSSVPERTVRVRTKGEYAFLTIKGATNESGLSRFEWEREIAVNDAEVLLKICEPGVIDKIRYEVRVGKHIFEVDEFFGENSGLVIAEIELMNEDEAFEKPSWLGREVTNDTRYYNASLIKRPFSRW